MGLKIRDHRFNGQAVGIAKQAQFLLRIAIHTFKAAFAPGMPHPCYYTLCCVIISQPYASEGYCLAHLGNTSRFY